MGINRALTIIIIVSILCTSSISISSVADDQSVDGPNKANTAVNLDIVDEQLKKIIPFGTYLGGNGDEYGNEILTDSNGNIYVVGSTTSSDFPVLNAYQDTNAGGEDMFVSSFTSAGVLRWSTYIGGAAQDIINDAVIDNANNLYVIGLSKSSDFPLLNEYQVKTGSSVYSSVIVFSMTSDGQLRWSTFFGGDLPDFGMSIDSYGQNIVITGHTYSSTFPTTMGPTLQGSGDIFAASFNNTGYLTWSRLLGGSDIEIANAIKADSLGNLYI